MRLKVTEVAPLGPRRSGELVTREGPPTHERRLARSGLSGLVRPFLSLAMLLFFCFLLLQTLPGRTILLEPLRPLAATPSGRFLTLMTFAVNALAALVSLVGSVTCFLSRSSRA